MCFPPQPASVSTSIASSGRPSHPVIMNACVATSPLALLLPLLVAAGCSSSSSKEEHAVVAPAVPWIAAKPAQVAEREPVARACRASDLEAPRQVKFVPRLHGGIALVPLRNVSGSACRLTGRPRVIFVKDGGPEQVQKPFPTTPANFPETTYPAVEPARAAARRVRRRHDRVGQLVRSGRQGEAAPAAERAADHAAGRARQHRHRLQRRAAVHRPQRADDDRRLRLPAEPDPDRAPVDERVPARVGAAASRSTARRGGTLRFRVVLDNGSQTTVRFDRCPAYAQQLVPRGSVEAYTLNCRAAHPIAPGKSLAFAMRVRVPQNAPLGANGLFWELDPFGARAPQVHARVTIDK